MNARQTVSLDLFAFEPLFLTPLDCIFNSTIDKWKSLLFIPDPKSCTSLSLDGRFRTRKGLDY